MSERVEVRVPDIGEFEDVPVIEVLVAPGDSVAEEDSLLTLESDKATMEVPAPTAGTVQSIEVAVGDTVSEGDLIAVLEATERAASAAPADEAPAGTLPAAETTVVSDGPTGGAGNSRRNASPTYGNARAAGRRFRLRRPRARLRTRRLHGRVSCC